LAPLIGRSDGYSATCAGSLSNAGRDNRRRFANRIGRTNASRLANRFCPGCRQCRSGAGRRSNRRNGLGANRSGRPSSRRRRYRIRRDDRGLTNRTGGT
jgi:hypothetical protein